MFESLRLRAALWRQHRQAESLRKRAERLRREQADEIRVLDRRIARHEEVVAEVHRVFHGPGLGPEDRSWLGLRCREVEKRLAELRMRREQLQESIAVAEGPQ